MAVPVKAMMTIALTTIVMGRDLAEIVCPNAVAGLVGVSLISTPASAMSPSRRSGSFSKHRFISVFRFAGVSFGSRVQSGSRSIMRASVSVAVWPS